MALDKSRRGRDEPRDCFDWRSRYQHPFGWERDYPLLTVPQMLENSAARSPNAPLADFMGRRFSYAAMLRQAKAVAAGLQALGISKGDRVGLFLPNVPHYIAAYYGAMMAGATLVNFSPLYTVDELSAQVEDSGTTLLFTLDVKALLPTALAVLEKSSVQRLVVGNIAEVLPPLKAMAYRLFKGSDRLPIPADPRITRYSQLISNTANPQPVEIDPAGDIALLQYTGGTTGTPKGAMLSHQNLTVNCRQVLLLDPDWDREADRILGILPFFHVFANTCVLNRTVLNGGMIAMLPRFDAGQALATIMRVKATAMPGVPTMYQALLDHPDIDHTDFSSLRVCISGGAPMAAELKSRFEEVTQATLVEGYGLTESSGVVSSNPYMALNKSGSIGQPLAMTGIRLLDKEDPAKLAPDGEPGELAVSGPQIMQGYWNRPEESAQVFQDGYLRTGDVAMVDADGFLTIVDRIKDMIAVGGFKVFPSQIEAVLYHHEAVKEALVIGVADAYRGEVPKAFVSLQPDAIVTGDDLMIWLNGRLGKHERVQSVVVRESLPKTMIGKLDRKALRAEELRAEELGGSAG